MKSEFWESKTGFVLRYLSFIPAFIAGYALVNLIANVLFGVFDNWFAGAILLPALGMILGAEFASRVLPSKNKIAIGAIVCLFWILITCFTFVGAAGESLERKSIVTLISSFVGGLAAIKFIVYAHKA